MAETENTIRLSKAAKELGVSINTIIGFLTSKGFKLDNNPNHKISNEEHRLLLKEYALDKSAKEEAQQITQQKIKEDVILEVKDDHKGTRRRDSDEVTIKQVVSSPEAPPKKVIPPPPTVQIPPPPPPVVPIATPIAAEGKKPKADELFKPEIESLKVSVVGKIDLDESKPKSTKKTKETSPEIKETTTGKKKKTEASKEPEQTNLPLPAEEVKKVEAPAPIEAALPVPVDTLSPPVSLSDTLSPSVSHPPEVTPVVSPEVPKEEGLFRMEREKHKGPTILGKIELPVEPTKKKQGPNEGQSQGKKKRKRTDKKPAPAGSSAFNRDTNKGQGQRPTGTGGGGGGTQTPGAPRPAQRFDRGAHAPRPEPTEKEIQDQIKATLARLSGQSKSKSSKYRKTKRESAEKTAQAATAEQDAQKKNLRLAEFVSVNDLARMMEVPVTQVISTCMGFGIFVSINQRLDAETITVVADEFGYKVEFITVDSAELILEEIDKEEDLLPRAPIVTVMGHVDHGKTSLLDYIRKTNVIAGEAGGITQHIGAYELTLEGGKHITFLDTPGHEAFTAMRARGAKLTDVAIIVIAADDSVMPQTIEAINHAQAANVKIVFAINKIDKPGANAEKIREQLSQMNILVEDWGGKYMCQEISAKKGNNVDKLLEKVLFEAEVLDLKANPNKQAVGTVIESELDKGRGYMITVLVQSGTLHLGDIILAGSHSGRVKALFNERGTKVKQAGPAQPVMVLGMNGAPQAGDKFNVLSDEREAREIATKRMQLQREQGLRTHKHITLDEIGRRLAIGNFKELNVIIKGDVDGSVEALSDAILKLSTPEIQVNVIHKSVGQISESDVLLASASEAIILGFQVRPSLNARKLAEQEQIEIRLYSIIYDAINEIRSAMEGMLSPEYEEKITSNIEIREVFKIPKVGSVAGCMVLDGKITRNTRVRLIRDGIVVYSGELASLKRFKDDAKEVSAGYECGMSIANFNDMKTGDIIEGYEQVAVKRKL